jgi:endonuclease YncB( thermonuclease family)
MMSRTVSSLLLAGLLVGGTAAAQGVTDGDSLLLDGKAYRLNGIDAPELEQVCPDGWPAGVEAERYLRELVEGRKVDCIVLAGERNGLPFALCRADGVDLSSAMVTAGRAFAFIPYSAQYIAQEAAAARANRGVHAHRCLPPWKWRAQLEEAQ